MNMFISETQTHSQHQQMNKKENAIFMQWGFIWLQGRGKLFHFQENK